jgi:cytochrome b6-f complex iron-sulfur subunit
MAETTGSQAADAAGKAASDAANAAKAASQDVQKAAGEVVDAAKDVAKAAGDTANQAAGEAADAAKDAADAAQKTANDAANKAASTVKPVGGASSIKPAGGVSSIKPAGGASSIKPAGGASSIKPAGGASSIKPAAAGAAAAGAAGAASGAVKPAGVAPAAGAAKPPAKEEAAPTAPPKGVTRREFLNYVWGASMALFLVQFGGITWFFSMPRFREGEFGGKISVRIADFPQTNQPPVANNPGKFWLVNVDQGIGALYKICTHLGCIYPWSDAAGIFACPCHGSQFELNGDWIAGPAPRDLDRFAFEVLDGQGNVIADSPTGDFVPIPSGAETVRVNTGAKILGQSHF